MGRRPCPTPCDSTWDGAHGLRLVFLLRFLLPGGLRRHVVVYDEPRAFQTFWIHFLFDGFGDGDCGRIAVAYVSAIGIALFEVANPAFDVAWLRADSEDLPAIEL